MIWFSMILSDVHGKQNHAEQNHVKMSPVRRRASEDFQPLAGAGKPTADADTHENTPELAA
jgi:hypothetical protein